MDKLVTKNRNLHLARTKPPDENEAFSEPISNENERVIELNNSDNEITFS